MNDPLVRIGRCYKCGGPVDLAAAVSDAQGARHQNCDPGRKAKYPAFSWPKDRVVFKSDTVVDGD
jgi:hypothetical protein